MRIFQSCSMDMTGIKKGTWIVFLLAIALACGSEKAEEREYTIKDIDDLKTRQYAINGKVLYERLCANCHQEDGSGLGKLIPPLAGSDYMNEDIGRTIRIIKHGMEGEIMVNGVVYNQPMPPNPQLTPMDISEITTYIYNVWGNKQGLITPGMVRENLEK